MIDDVHKAAAEAIERVDAAATLDELRSLDADVLGKRSPLTQVKAGLRDLEPNARREVGKAVNEARTAIEEAVARRTRLLEAGERRSRLAQERLDLTEVVQDTSVGHHHLVSRIRHDLEDVFIGMGYTVAEGPEVESDWYNFEALNIPAAHPARSMWDTLYVDLNDPESTLLRTHTSPVQIRTMQVQEPPIYIVAPGRVFRRDTPDATHLPVFHQIEGLVVDRGVTFGDLAGTIEAFTQHFFGTGYTTRLRPSYFPFTEPSAEFDVGRPDGSWLELGGCGMVHPNVFRAVGLDPEEWSGFAFGFGIDRFAMIHYGVDDLRDLFSNDIRILEQF